LCKPWALLHDRRSAHGRGSEDAPGSVQGRAQIVGCGLRFEVRPQQIHQLLAVEPVLRSQCQQLDDRDRLAPPPRGILYLARPNADAELSQELDAQILAIVR
jgi:hypothetical protein